MTTFNNVEFPTKDIWSNKQKQYYTVSTDGLNALLFNDDEPINEEAETIDNSIGYYVPIEILQKQSQEIAKYIKENIDSEF